MKRESSLAYRGSVFRESGGQEAEKIHVGNSRNDLSHSSTGNTWQDQESPLVFQIPGIRGDKWENSDRHREF
jgi:hypothetical protein